MINAGAHDYLLKDKMTRFASVVERELRETIVRRDLVKANEQLDLLNQYLVNAREDERRLISLEIHDELGQTLTALKLDMNWVRGNIHDEKNSVDKLTNMIEMTNFLIKKVQRISSELHPGLLDDLGLVSTIEWYCGEFEDRSGIKCHLELEDLSFEDSKINLALFRILQEALTNVIRHSGASSVNIELHYKEPVFTMTIEDNGIGIPSERLELSGSLGMAGMHERARHCGGKIEFVTKEGKGTKLIVTVNRHK
jgi:two-component system sensor histidine kinase UhpB